MYIIKTFICQYIISCYFLHDIWYDNIYNKVNAQLYIPDPEYSWFSAVPLYRFLSTSVVGTS